MLDDVSFGSSIKGDPNVGRETKCRFHSFVKILDMLGLELWCKFDAGRESALVNDIHSDMAVPEGDVVIIDQKVVVS